MENANINSSYPVKLFLSQLLLGAFCRSVCLSFKIQWSICSNYSYHQ